MPISRNTFLSTCKMLFTSSAILIHSSNTMSNLHHNNCCLQTFFCLTPRRIIATKEARVGVSGVLGLSNLLDPRRIRGSQSFLRDFCLMLRREWGNGLWGNSWGLYRDYYRDPFPHSLLSTRGSRLWVASLGFRFQGLGFRV